MSKGDRHALGLKIGVETLDTAFTAPARLFVTAERHRHVACAPAIDPDDTRLDPRRQLVCLGHVARPDGGGETIDAVIGLGGDLVDIVHRLRDQNGRSEEHTSELQSLMRLSYAVFCLKKQTRILIT